MSRCPHCYTKITTHPIIAASDIREAVEDDFFALSDDFETAFAELGICANCLMSPEDCQDSPPAVFSITRRSPVAVQTLDDKKRSHDKTQPRTKRDKVVHAAAEREKQLI